MFDFFGFIDAFFMSAKLTRNMNNPEDEPEQSKKDNYREAVIEREKRIRREQLKKHRNLQKSHTKTKSKNNDFENNR